MTTLLQPPAPSWWPVSDDYWLYGGWPPGAWPYDGWP
jgi:hypothetical protein